MKFKSLSGIPGDRFTSTAIKSKVLGNPSRIPINMQAVRVMMPTPWWAKPFPADMDLTKKENVLALKAKVEELRLLLVDECITTREQLATIKALRYELKSRSNVRDIKILPDEKDAIILDLTNKNKRLESDNQALSELVGLI